MSAAVSARLTKCIIRLWQLVVNTFFDIFLKSSIAIAKRTAFKNQAAEAWSELSSNSPSGVQGYRLAFDAPTNQIFLVLDEAQKTRLSKHVEMGFWENLADGKTVMRIATSWATQDEDVDRLIALL